MGSRSLDFLFSNRQALIDNFFGFKKTKQKVFCVFMQKIDDCDHVKNNQKIHDCLQVIDNELKEMKRFRKYLN